MAQYELSLQDYWRILRKRRLTILITIIVVASLSVWYNNTQTPVYSASVQIRIARPQTLAQTLMGTLMNNYYEDPLVTEAQVLRGRTVARGVARRLQTVDEIFEPEAFELLVTRIQGSVIAEPMRKTSIIGITVLGDDPQWVADVANFTAEVYVAHNTLEKSSNARTVRQFIEAQLADTEERLRIAEDKKRTLREQGASGLAEALDERLLGLHRERADLLSRATPLHPTVIRLEERVQDVQKELRDLPDEELELSRVSRELLVTEETYIVLRKKLEEARIAEAEKMENISIINAAAVPRMPIRPNKQLGYIVGVALGLMVGVVIVFVLENMDTSLGTIEDVEQLLQVPVLGVIPHIRADQTAKDEGKNRPKQPWFSWGWKPAEQEPMQIGLFAHFYPKAPETEAFRTLRTNLNISADRKVILITSSGPKEGKTHIAANLGVVFAQAGTRVLLIASDLRKPALSKAFGLKRETGVTEVLAGSISAEKATRGFADFVMGKLGFNQAMQTPGLDNLHILPSGHIPVNPSELLASQEMKNLLSAMREQYDLVILDSPPVLPITDSMLLAPIVDGVVLTYEVGRTAQAALQRSKAQIELAGGNVFGIILNHVHSDTQYPAYYYYSYKYRYELPGEGAEAAEHTPSSRS